jgi:hypothetical protein
MRHAALIILLFVIPATAFAMSGKPPAKQKYLFEYSNINFAWGFKMSGIYIDGKGDVYKYDRQSPWKPSGKASYLEADLREKYAHDKARIGTVSQSKLHEMYRLIKHAGDGQISEPVHRCADFGTGTYTAYIYNKEGMSYTPVLLYQFGDVARKNTSEEAKKLYEWLFKVTKVAPHNCMP